MFLKAGKKRTTQHFCFCELVWGLSDLCHSSFFHLSLFLLASYPLSRFPYSLNFSSWFCMTGMLKVSTSKPAAVFMLVFFAFDRYVFAPFFNSAFVFFSPHLSPSACPGRVRTRRTSSGNSPSVTDSRGRSRGKVVSQSQRGKSF